MERVRRRYLAGFYAPAEAATGEVREIRVRLRDQARASCPNCVVRARSRYTVQ
ncbi:MAG TPA: hypothetical protein VNJ11_06885 [Bryobacteraceae bacterium]|nr:hypothetical protein [Bryobacteraceae bacterium]